MSYKYVNMLAPKGACWLVRVDATTWGSSVDRSFTILRSSIKKNRVPSFGYKDRCCHGQVESYGKVGKMMT